MSGTMAIIDVLKHSGVTGVVVGAMGIATVWITIERYRALNLRSKEDNGEFIGNIKDYVLNDQIGKAITYCDSHKSIPASFVVKSILERANRDEASMINAAGLKLSQIESSLNKRIEYLPAIANAVTLVGLFGTILGLIMSFASLGDAANKQEALSGGISLAMSATAMGLAVAIPALLSYAYLAGRLNKIMDQAEQYGSTTVDLLKSRLFK